jgi:N-acetylmuramoyl-L-alanine amidase
MRWTEAGLALAIAGLTYGFAQNARPARPQPPQAPSPLTPSTPPPAAKPFVVVIDAAHGGSDDGARLGKGVLEKNLTLAMAEQLKAMLREQGIAVTMTRNIDVDLPTLNQAEIANHAQAAACLVLHATATGSGVHLFTSSLSPAPRTELLPWESAQAAFVTESLKLESELDAALVHAEIPVTMGRASVAPMDNMDCPTVAVELAPLAPGNATRGRTITNERYQKAVEGALAVAIGSWRTDQTER